MNNAGFRDRQERAPASDTEASLGESTARRAAAEIVQ